MSGAVDIQGYSYTLGYNDRGDATSVSYPGLIASTLGYDADGYLASESLANQGVAFPRYPNTTMRAFSVTSRNGRGQILQSADAAPFANERVLANYDGLGRVTHPQLHQTVVTVQNSLVSYASGDLYTYDGLGNRVTGTQADTVLGVGTFHNNGATIAPTTGRLTQRQGDVTTDYMYDEAGNTVVEKGTGVSSTVSERRLFYGADDQMVASDTRTIGPIQRVFEEYRYDALGRRIWLRSNRTCEGTLTEAECHNRSVRRTIWDGNQELAEIQAPVDTTDTTVEEKDQASGANGWGLRPCQSIGGKCFADPNPYFGRVVYGPALRTDQPISVTRFDYQDEQRSASPPISGTWPTFTIVPYWNYQGAPSFSTFGTATNGAGLAWLPLSKGASQSVCPPLADTTAQRCVRFQWPFARSAYDQNRGKAARFSWLGSLLENKRDGSGLEYKRSRQYDPLSGRFTQEDPIGLAGGLNLYGFASGDPVNFSDPFGLDTLRYNGRTLTLIGDDGKTRWSGRAYSGRPGTTASEQFVSDRGPIPEGEYSLDPSKISHVTGVRAWIRNRLGDWGEYRVGLTPEAGTDTRGRDGLMLHGGKKPGSAGCIDVCGLEGTLFPLLMSHNGTIRVIVGYPSGSTVPTPPQ